MGVCGCVSVYLSVSVLARFINNRLDTCLSLEAVVVEKYRSVFSIAGGCSGATSHPEMITNCS